MESACARSEEHTSELQSHSDLVCRLLLDKNNCSHPQPSPRHFSLSFIFFRFLTGRINQNQPHFYFCIIWSFLECIRLMIVFLLGVGKNLLCMTAVRVTMSLIWFFTSCLILFTDSDRQSYEAYAVELWDYVRRRTSTHSVVDGCWTDLLLILSKLESWINIKSVSEQRFDILCNLFI